MSNPSPRTRHLPTRGTFPGPSRRVIVEPIRVPRAPQIPDTRPRREPDPKRESDPKRAPVRGR